MEKPGLEKTTVLELLSHLTEETRLMVYRDLNRPREEKFAGKLSRQMLQFQMDSLDPEQVALLQKEGAEREQAKEMARKAKAEEAEKQKEEDEAERARDINGDSKVN